MERCNNNAWVYHLDMGRLICGLRLAVIFVSFQGNKKGPVNGNSVNRDSP
jgi:hypothetical protein